MLVAVGALVGLWAFRRELRRSGLPESALDAGIAGVVGGMAGAKVLWTLEHLGEESFTDLILSRGGMSLSRAVRRADVGSSRGERTDV